jgi:hypothetical protein
MSAYDALALALAASGVLAALLAGAVTREPRAGFPMMLELWTAAGILRLLGGPAWGRIVSAAVVIVLRRIVTSSLGERRSVRR